MKQRPILFSTPMVEAILKGTKNQTRRAIKTQPNDNHIGISFGYTLNDNSINGALYHKKDSSVDFIKCPYGKVGDVFWVRETWKFLGQSILEEFEVMFKDGTINEIDYADQDVWLERLENLADLMEKKGKVISNDENERFEWKKEDVPWKPSIHMPKEIARIWLEITNIRIERLNNISEEDAIAEGIEEIHPAPFVIRYKDYLDDEEICLPESSFMSLWESINGRGSWDENPWVWVIEFKQIEKPENN